MAKKLTPGKGGAKGMHKGHAYKENCQCVICKAKRKKQVGSNDSPDTVTPQYILTPEQDQYVLKVTYPGISTENTKGEFDGENFKVIIDEKFHRTFVLKNCNSDKVVTQINGDTLTVMVAKNATEEQPSLTTETVNEFPKGEEQEIVRNPEDKPQQPEKDEVNLKGEITIEDSTYQVMREHVVKLRGAIPETDHNKFMNELVNKAIVTYCKTLK